MYSLASLCLGVLASQGQIPGAEKHTLHFLEAVSDVCLNSLVK